MKAKPYKWDGKAEWTPCEPQEATHISIFLPCGCQHLMLPVQTSGTRAGTGNWTWNGDTEKPTIKPSVSTTGHDFKCHTWINDGAMQFLTDTTGRGHEGLGGTVQPLREVET